ncbi:MAG: hypothetical protein GY866_27870 [Proteobacteria bacterium]|nr:hypothetical protein [Pseudomonadota bacterium]
MEDWERHYIENKDKTFSEKREDQFVELVDVLEQLKSFFEPVFLLALKNAEGENLTENEVAQLQHSQDAHELVERIKGLKKGFDSIFYTALEKVVGDQSISISKKRDRNESQESKDRDLVRLKKLPKGFGKWDLKQIKLHESNPAKDERVWVEYWSLKGDTAVGEILYNEAKDVHYFRPYDYQNNPTFPLSEDQGRKSTREGRNYYFKKTMAPEEES